MVLLVYLELVYSVSQRATEVTEGQVVGLGQGVGLVDCRVLFKGGCWWGCLPIVVFPSGLYLGQ